MQLKSATWAMHVLIIGSLGCACAPVAHADFTDEPYLLRLVTTFDRQNNDASTLARQASVAYPGGTSANPAGAGWAVPGESTLGATATVVVGSAQSGALIVAAPISVRLQSPTLGSVSFAYARTDTRDDSGEGGNRQVVESDEFWLGYGRKLSPTTSFGAQVKVTRADITHESATLLNGAPGRMDTEYDEISLTAGVLTAVTEATTLGIAALVGRGDADNTVSNITDLPVPVPFPPFTIIMAPGTVSLNVDDTITSYIGRVGIGTKLSSDLGLYGDLTAVHFKGDVAGTATLERLSVGAEYATRRKLVILAGATVDSAEEVSPSLGLSRRWPNDFVLTAAYQHNAAPEVRQEFRRMRVVSVSLSGRF